MLVNWIKENEKETKMKNNLFKWREKENERENKNKKTY